jgi:RNA polymerase sigma-70 factor (ECF subfamily)
MSIQPSIIDDLTLLTRIRNHDQEAIQALHQRYANLVYSITYRVLNDATAAEEAMQDTFLKVWQSAQSFDESRGAPLAWLSRIARNTAIDYTRLRARRVTVDDTFDIDDGRMLPLPDGWQDRERTQALRQALSLLPSEQGQVLALAYFGGLSQSDIADQLKIPLGTVKTRMRIGLQKLREAWFSA